MNLGQIVYVTDMEREHKLDHKRCFVEALVQGADRNYGPHKGVEQVSLYADTGEYVGDYWADELEVTFEHMNRNELIALCNRAEIQKNSGSLQDFRRVLKWNGHIATKENSHA